MNKAVLTAAVLAGMVSGSAIAATVYNADGTELKIGGRVEVVGLLGGDDDGAEVEGTMADESRARINFKGKTQLSEGLSGFAAWEGQMADGESELDNRTMYVGLQSGETAFSYGRQNTANVQISDMSDIASWHSGNNQYIKSASDKENQTFLITTKFSDVSLNASYQASDAEDQDAVGISALWSSDFGLDLGASYTAAGDEGSTGGDSGEAKQTTFGLGYSIDKVYLGATYATGDKNETTDFDSLEAAVQFKVTKQLRLIGVYAQAQENDEDVTDYFALEAQYRFNDVLRTYASYKFEQMEDLEDSLALGLRYDF